MKQLIVIRLGALVCAVTLFSLLLPGQSGGQVNALIGLNNALIQLYSQTLGASPAAAAEARRRAVDVIVERAALLESLVQQDPAAALGIGFSADLAAELADAFPASAAQLEQRGQWTGVYEAEVGDAENFRSSEETRGLRLGLRRVELFFAGDDDPTPGSTLTADGLLVGGSLAAGSTQEQTASAAAGPSCSVVGEQRIAVIKVRFPGTAPSLGNTSIQDWLFGAGDTVNGFWQENSFGQTWASGNVFPAGSDAWYDLAQGYTCDSSQFDDLLLAAMAAADGDVDFNDYERVLVVFPNNSECSGLAGRASLDCSRYAPDGSLGVSWAIQRHDQMNSRDRAVKLTTHEGGHNLGLHHSSSLDYGPEPLGDPTNSGSQDEYGDIFSTMGSWNDGHYTSDHKRRLGWLPSYQTVSTSGAFTVSPYSSPVGTQALRVDRGDTGQHLWVEFRRRLGQFYSTSGSATDGALIHFQSDGSGRTRLLDFTPGTSSFGDSGLAAGQSWSDPYSNLTIETVSASDSGLQVNVSYGAVECISQAPAVSISPSSTTVSEPDPASFAVSVTNNDNSGCASEVFDLTAAIAGPNAAALGYSFSSSVLTLAPGATGSSTLTVTPISSPASGSHTVTATAAKNAAPAQSDAASAGLTVLEPTFTLSLSIAGNGVVTVQETGQTCSGTCSISISQGNWTGLTLEATSTHKKHQFCSWAADCSAEATAVCSLSAPGDYTVGAEFGSKCGGGSDGGGPGGGGGGGNGGGNGGGKGGGKPPK